MNNKQVKRQIYHGSSKILFQPEDDSTLIMAFTDDIMINDTNTKITIPGKGVINNAISAFIMNTIDMVGIEHHMIKKINMLEQLVQFVDIFPIQVFITSIACGRYVKDLGMEEGYVFDSPVIDFVVKNRDLRYPSVNEHQLINFSWMSSQEVKQLKYQATRVYDFLTGLFAGVSLRLVECKLEFGRVFNGEKSIIMLADEITPDNCRIWDMNTNAKYGFEEVINNLDNAIQLYQTVLRRFNLHPDND